jgi:hypothetical protein
VTQNETSLSPEEPLLSLPLSSESESRDSKSEEDALSREETPEAPNPTEGIENSKSTGDDETQKDDLNNRKIYMRVHGDL